MTRFGRKRLLHGHRWARWLACGALIFLQPASVSAQDQPASAGAPDEKPLAPPTATETTLQPGIVPAPQLALPISVTPPPPPASDYAAIDDDLARMAATGAPVAALSFAVNAVSEHGYQWRIVRYARAAQSLAVPGAPQPEGGSATSSAPVAMPNAALAGAAPYWVVLHDNEDAAFDTMLWALKTYGGEGVAVETPPNAILSQRRYMPPGTPADRRLLCQRRFFTLLVCDPNRNFGADTPLYSSAIFAGRKPGQPVVALHSNAMGQAGDGRNGQGNISLRQPNGRLRVGAFRGRPGLEPPLGDDDFVLIPVRDRAPVEPDPVCGAKLVARGVNIFYEVISDDRYDGSLSHYMTRYGLGTYFNIEVGANATSTERQTAMLKLLMESCLATPPAGQ